MSIAPTSGATSLIGIAVGGLQRAEARLESAAQEVVDPPTTPHGDLPDFPVAEITTRVAYSASAALIDIAVENDRTLFDLFA